MRAEAETKHRQLRASRGATLVEYALGVALLVVASLVGLNFLTDSATTEANAQADCISTRPPPTSCVRKPAPAATTPTTPAPTVTSTTLTPTPTDPPPTTQPPPKSSATAGTALLVKNPDGTWKVTAPITITATGGAPVPGAVVTGRVVLGRQPILVECTTDGAGTCNLVLDPIPADVTTARLEIVGLQADPPGVGAPYPAWDLTKPT